MHTFATRNERDAGCCLKDLEDIGEQEKGVEGGMKKPDDKKLQINFAGVGKVSTFAVPNKTGTKKAEGAMPDSEPR